MAAATSLHPSFVAAVALLGPALLACPSAPYPEERIDLARAAPPATARPAAAGTKLRFSVAAMFSPQGSLTSYSRLFALMAERLGVEIEFVQRRTYREVNDLLATGQVDAALICTGGYLELARVSPGRVEILAVPVVGDVSTYHSYVIVPTSSRAATLADLHGRRFAYTDELSLTGRGYPIHWLRRSGVDPAAFFGTVQFTQSHDRSVEAVARGVVDGAAVDSLIYDEMVARRPDLSGAVRILDRSPPFGSPPVVASTAVPAERRAAIRAVLLGLDRDPEGRRALAAIGFDRFAPPSPSLYDGARAVMEAAR